MILPDEQFVTLHTRNGITLYEFGPAQMKALKWTRELRDTSIATLTLAPRETPEELGDMAPWRHWMTVWSGLDNSLLWTGPVYARQTNRAGVIVNARDCSALVPRTRVPITKKWEGVDPSVPAYEMWLSLIELHNLHAECLRRSDPDGKYCDYAAVADAAMMDTAIADLVNLGLRWTVVSGVPILGPMPDEPVTTLDEDDFMGDGLELTRDGAKTYNDILLRGATNMARVRVPLGDLNLQTIINADSMFSVSNVDQATRQAAEYYAAVRDSVSVAQGTTLHPDAPITLDQLVPSMRLIVAAYGIRTVMELEGIEVNLEADKADIGVTLESVPDLPELTVSDVPASAALGTTT